MYCVSGHRGCVAQMAPGVMNWKDLSCLSWKGASVMALCLCLPRTSDSTADPELDQAELIILTHASFQSPNCTRPSYAVLQFKGWRETGLGPFLATKGLENCVWQARVWLMPVTPGLGRYRQIDPELEHLLLKPGDLSLNPQHPWKNPGLAVTLT